MTTQIYPGVHAETFRRAAECFPRELAGICFILWMHCDDSQAKALLGAMFRNNAAWGVPWFGEIKSEENAVLRKAICLEVAMALDQYYEENGK